MDLTPNQTKGVLKEIIKEGVGTETPSTGNEVTVHYTGTLLDGTKFDSSKDRNQPFKFKLGVKQVIRGWDLGIATMKKGEVAILTCTSKYAYGKKGSPPKIPPDATLKFEIEMIDWSGEDLSPEKDKSIQKFEIVSGSNVATPSIGSVVNVHLIGTYNGVEFENRVIEFTLGEGAIVGVVEGVEKALQTFKEGEKSKLKIKSKYAFKEVGIPHRNIPPNADIEYIVELKNFEKAPEYWLMDASEKIEAAQKLRERATEHLLSHEFYVAIQLYNRIIDSILTKAPDFQDELSISRENILIAINSNLALCYLKTNDYVKAKNACNQVLDINSKYEKALFRRGQAHIGLASYEDALKDFEQVIEIEPKNVAALKQIKVCKDFMQKHVAKEKKLYANMFEKFAKEDKQKEEEKLREQPDVMRGTLGEWGQEEREGGRDATAFEKENPNILMLNANGTGEFQNM